MAAKESLPPSLTNLQRACRLVHRIPWRPPIVPVVMLRWFDSSAVTSVDDSRRADLVAGSSEDTVRLLVAFADSEFVTDRDRLTVELDAGAGGCVAEIRVGHRSASSCHQQD